MLSEISVAAETLVLDDVEDVIGTGGGSACGTSCDVGIHQRTSVLRSYSNVRIYTECVPRGWIYSGSAHLPDRRIDAFSSVWKRSSGGELHAPALFATVLEHRLEKKRGGRDGCC